MSLSVAKRGSAAAPYSAKTLYSTTTITSETNRNQKKRSPKPFFGGPTKLARPLSISIGVTFTMAQFKQVQHETEQKQMKNETSKQKTLPPNCRACQALSVFFLLLLLCLFVVVQQARRRRRMVLSIWSRAEGCFGFPIFLPSLQVGRAFLVATPPSPPDHAFFFFFFFAGELFLILHGDLGLPFRCVGWQQGRLAQTLCRGVGFVTQYDTPKPIQSRSTCFPNSTANVPNQLNSASPENG